MAKLRVAGINFAHMHMGDNLRMVAAHPECELVAVCDESRDRMTAAIADLQIAQKRVFTDYQQCLEQTRPDLVVLCPPTAEHARWTERVFEFGAHVLLEKPFANSVAEADAMILAAQKAQRLLAINWPLAWVPSHRSTKRLVDEGAIGRVKEVHYYDGNRGPLWHTAGKETVSAEEVAAQRPTTWFYQREHGGGSLRDYLGYGVTLGTWFNGGRRPLAVSTMVDQPAGLEVDEQSVTVARYETGLSTFQTRWGTFTDPWTHQPQPKCGFVIVGESGTISSYDYELTIRVQTRDDPAGIELKVDAIQPPHQNPVQDLVHCIHQSEPVEGPLSPELSRLGQEIVDAAVKSANEARTVSL